MLRDIELRPNMRVLHSVIARFGDGATTKVCRATAFFCAPFESQLDVCSSADDVGAGLSGTAWSASGCASGGHLSSSDDA